MWAVLSLSLMSFPRNPTEISLDPSWQQALAEAAKSRLQAGVDYVFTYGPLGFLMDSIVSGPGRFFNTHYDGALFYYQMAWEVAAALFLSLAFMMVFYRLGSTLEKAVFAAVAILALPISKDALYLVSLVGVTVLVVRDYSGRFWAVCAALFFLAVVALMKFTFFLTAGVCVAAILVAVRHDRSWKGAAGTAALYAAFVALLWITAGQSPLNFPQYLKNSLRIAAGYDGAMAIYGPSSVLISAVCILALTAAMAAISAFARPFEVTRFAASAVIVCGVFVAWKAGFVRQDLHTLIFFTVAAAAPFLFPRPPGRSSRLKAAFTVLVLAQVLLAALGAYPSGRLMGYTARNLLRKRADHLAANANTLLSPRMTKRRLEIDLHRLRKQNAVPAVREIVKDQAVDLLSCDQALLFLNDLNWRPRPVFQSYSAYTPELVAMNAAFFRGAAAPDFVVIRLWPIDSHYAMMEDAGALEVILRDYAPVRLEKGYLLFQRQETPVPAPAEPGQTLARAVGPDDWVSVSEAAGACRLLRVTVDYSFAGRLRKFFYKAPPVFMYVRTTAGNTHSYRMIPGMAVGGFIITPFIRNQKDLVTWCAGGPLDAVDSVRISVDRRDMIYFNAPFSVEISPCDIEPPAVSEEVRANLLAEMGSVEAKSAGMVPE